MSQKHLFPAVFLALVLPLSATGFAVTPQYHRDRPLYILPGEELQFYIHLQNSGDAAAEVSAMMADGKGVASIGAQEYTLPPHTVQNKAWITVRAPEDAVLGDNYTIELVFREKPEEKSGMVAIATSISISVPVIVRMPAEDEVPIRPSAAGGYVFMYLTGLVLVILSLYYLGQLVRKKRVSGAA